MQERVDTAGGIAAWASLAGAGVKDKNPRDFMPDWQASQGQQDRPQQSAEEMIGFMRGLQSRGKRKRRNRRKREN